MKRLTIIYCALSVSGLLAFAMLSSCNKQNEVSDLKAAASSTAATTNGDILISAGSVSTLSATKDSVYLMKACPPGKRPDTIAFSALPAAIATYLTANYSGYTAQKAFKIADRSGSLTGYVVAINYNSKAVGLKFDAAGTFVNILEQREPRDHAGPGWHPGGRFENRNGLQKDTIALSALPFTIKTYFTANYATDTLLHAVMTRDSGYIVLSANKGLFATSFTSKLAFVKRIQLHPRPIKSAVAQAALPAAITTYLNTTYAGYVFGKAFTEKVNGVVARYVVLIDVSGTRYAVHFDASGAFVKSITIK
ncbi:PepSY-like domain-containing protein [Mucilaginibacter myungsuensis]|uniref:PepSY-like domain-containing protein n=1 Tax=Mucilaginibacter myungsuensis TaxID=649104 RepID=A0A929KVW4_9SPHI|nr:PepSY-like domain-containing protein [Mucilaginibacter myungsuensis]MBE9660863.1 PepSY-like domain-containing protein [Mucilaginibacter myungsuensis]MDN3600910.1 PepSY-like domain-containing protein [Mucilaginibacter myungsuensis]